MPTGEQWREAVARIRENPGNLQAQSRLYYLAIAETGWILRRSGFSAIAVTDHIDIAHDVLAFKADRIVEADDPRAFFIQCLVNRAIDVIRRWHSRRDDGEPGGGEGSGSVPTDPLQPVTSELLAVMNELAEGNRVHAQICFAVMVLDEDVALVAKAFGETPENIYKIVSRARRRLKLAREGA